MSDDRARFDYLDGLRGWAALSVVVFHASWETFGLALPGIRTPYLGLLNDGPFAVAVFFALSGFVLSRRFIATGDRAGLQRMAAGRYVRLALPVGIISFIGYLMAISGPLPNRAAGVIVQSEWVGQAMSFPFPPGFISFLKFCIYNVFTGSRAQMPYNQFTWTMMYELCGSYLLFATLALFGEGASLRRGSLALMFCISLYLDPLYSLFFGGALIADLNVTHYRQPLTRSVSTSARNGIGLALFAAAWLASALAREQYATAPALALLCSLLVSPWMQAFFSTRLSQFLGRISFPLYLVHGYVIFGPGAWAITTLTGLHLTMVQVAAMVVPGVIATSMVAGWLTLPVEHLAKTAAHLTGRILTGGITLSAISRAGRPILSRVERIS